jgi:hypothetical protein
MVDVTINLANSDVRSVIGWLLVQRALLADDMVGSQPTPESNRATLAYVMLGSILQQLLDHKSTLAKKEYEARERRGE